MKLIIGLGNPGEEYRNTRHNAGHLFVDELQKSKLPSGIVVKKSDTFMNESGSYVNESIHRYKVEPKDLYIVHDDLDIKLGEYKIQFGKGPKDHNGLRSIDENLETDQYWHVRVGIENRDRSGDTVVKGEDYVLQEFSDEERETIDEVIKKICKETIHLLQ